MSDTPRTDLMVTGNSDPGADEYEDLAAFTRQLERENADLRAKLEAAQRDAERWRYWRMFWPALCRMEVARFARIDLTRKHVQSPADMDEVTDAAMQEVKP